MTTNPEGGMFFVVAIRNNKIDCFFDCSIFIKGSIHIIDRNGSRKFPSCDFIELDELFINEESRGPAIK